MVKKRWLLIALVAVVVGAAAPPGSPASAAIFGPDTRTPVSPTTGYPASATVRLTFPGGQCTGFMISERTVASAGHCLHTGPGGTWRPNIVAYPGSDGSNAPFGSCAAVQLFAPVGWTGRSNAPGGGDPAHDYGAARLNCTVGTRTGWFGLGYPTQTTTGSCTTTQGYPSDRPGQWTSSDSVRAEDANFLYVRHPFTSGQDGSPIYFAQPPVSALFSATDWDELCPRPPVLVKPCPCPPPPPPCGDCPPITVAAILTTNPYATGPSLANNIATRITPEIVNNLMQWR
ncbi:trypsin-like serine peptidase [Micromonospora wenchangensis]|uniref:trypsin-like serine peptidase n=2 Tax=Micromonospora wenchangensis TaxID=1185415 RepID=UPI0026D2953A